MCWPPPAPCSPAGSNRRLVGRGSRDHLFRRACFGMYAIGQSRTVPQVVQLRSGTLRWLRTGARFRRVPETTVGRAKNDANVERESDETGTRKRIATSIARIIDNVADSWFACPATKWGFWKRFGCALAGSATFFAGSFVFPHLDESNVIFWDPDFSLTGVLSLVVRGVIAGWFAWLVSWKDVRHGPARLYLSGLLLPGFVSFILSGAFLPLLLRS